MTLERSCIGKQLWGQAVDRATAIFPLITYLVLLVGGGGGEGEHLGLVYTTSAQPAKTIPSSSLRTSLLVLGQRSGGSENETVQYM